MTISISDASLLLSLVSNNIAELSQYCDSMGIDKYVIPTFCHLCALQYDLDKFLKNPDQG